MPGSKRVSDVPVAVGTAEILQLIACPLRIEILLCLAEQPCDVGQLAAAIELELSHVSKNLSKLHAAGIVDYVRHGHRKIYSVSRSVRSLNVGDATCLDIQSPDGGSLRLTIPESVRAKLGRSTRAAAWSRVMSVPDDVPMVATRQAVRRTVS